MKEFNIKITEREAIILRAIFDVIGGHPHTTARGDIDNIKEKLEEFNLPFYRFESLFKLKGKFAYAIELGGYKDLIKETSSVIEMSIEQLEAKLGLVNLKIVK